MTGTGPVGGATLADAPLINGGVMSAPTPNAALTDVYAPWGMVRVAWWRYRPAADGFVRFEKLAGGDLLVVDENMNELPYTGAGAWQVTKWQNIYLAIGAYAETDMSYVLRVSRVQADWTPTGPAGSDNFATAGELITGCQSGTAGPGLTMEAGEPTGNSPLSQTAWWHWTAPRDGYAQLLGFSAGSVQAAVYTGTALDALTLVTWLGPNYAGGELGWLAQAGQSYYVQMGSYTSSGSSANYTPTLKLFPYVKTVSPATSVTAQPGNYPGTVVGGAGALSTTDLTSYVSGVSGNPFGNPAGSFFTLNFSPVILPPDYERLTIRFAVIAQSDSGTTAYAPSFWEKALNFSGTGQTGNGRSFRIAPLDTTPTFKDRGLDVGGSYWGYDVIANADNPRDYPTPLHLTMRYEYAVNAPGIPYKVYYAAWEIYSWGEEEEITPLDSLAPAIQASIGNINQYFQDARIR